MTADGAAEAYKASLDDPSGFWASEADRYHWQTPFDRSNVYSANFKRSAGPIAARWFEDGATNIAYNCLDRQVEAGLGDKLCFIAERNDEGETSPLQPETYTYAEALEETKKLAAALRAKGVKKGDRVALFCPWSPSSPSPCSRARIGAVTRSSSGASRATRSRRASPARARRASHSPAACAAAARSSPRGIAKDAPRPVFAASFFCFLSFVLCSSLRRAARALVLAPPLGAPRRVPPRRGMPTQARDQGTPVEGGAVGGASTTPRTRNRNSPPTRRGGTTSSRPPTAQTSSGWPPRTRSSSSTRLGARARPRASSTRRAATWSARATRSGRSSTRRRARTTSGSVRPTAAGSRATPTSPTAPC